MRDVLRIAQANRHTADRIAAALLESDARFARTPDGRWTLAGVHEPAASPALDTCRFAVVDVETTGTRARRGDRIIEIAVVIGGQVAFHTLVNPSMSIPPFVASLTGITDALVERAPPFDAVLDGLLDVLRDTVFVAHNARFDWAFLSAEVERARGLVLQAPRVCTMRLARRLLPDLERRNLDTVSDFFGITIEGRHRAVGDAVAAGRVLERLVGLAREQGAVTLADLLGVGYRVSGAGDAPPDTRHPVPGT
ncbi:MAG TPA: 3'-5' exonuclease [Gemmatimonadales bacterium]|nr:3'-5' exonuclease [Gemmatimonadales bacterium]